MTPRKKRTFTAEQKAEAVRIVEQSGKSVTQVAREMGLTTSALAKWVNQAKIDEEGSPEGALTSPERQELNQLRRELKRVEMERDFLMRQGSSVRLPHAIALHVKKVSRGGEGKFPHWYDVPIAESIA
jgi:transposase